LGPLGSTAGSAGQSVVPRAGSAGHIREDQQYQGGSLEGGAAVRYFFSNTIGAELGYGLGFL
jgi:hypothetical protein